MSLVNDEIDLQPHSEGSSIAVLVVPGASRDEIVGAHGGRLRIRVTAPAEAGKANKAVAALLKDTLGATDAYLIHGGRSRNKRYVLSGARPDQVRARLARLENPQS